MIGKTCSRCSPAVYLTSGRSFKLSGSGRMEGKYLESEVQGFAVFKSSQVASETQSELRFCATFPIFLCLDSDFESRINEQCGPSFLPGCWRVKDALRRFLVLR